MLFDRLGQVLLLASASLPGLVPSFPESPLILPKDWIGWMIAPAVLTRRGAKMLQSPGLIHFMPMVVEVWEGSCPRSLGSDQSDEGKCRTAFVRKEFSEASSWGGHFCPEVQEDDRQDKAAGETEEEASGWDFWSAGAPCPAFHGGREGEPGCLSWVRLVSGTNRAFAVYPHSADGAGCPGSRQATLALWSAVSLLQAHCFQTTCSTATGDLV